MVNYLVIHTFSKNLTLTSVNVTVTWVIECTLGCTLVPSKKTVGDIVSEIWPIVEFWGNFGTFDSVEFASSQQNFYRFYSTQVDSLSAVYLDCM